MDVKSASTQIFAGTLIKNQMRILAFLLTIALLISNVNAQGYNPASINKKAIVLFEKAGAKAESNKWSEALELLKNAISISPNYLEAYFLTAHINLELKDYANSCSYFKKGFAIDSTYSPMEYFSYSTALAGTGSFQKALDAINNYQLLTDPKDRLTIELVQKRKRSYLFGIEYAKAHPDADSSFKPINLGPEVNSKMPEYFPSLPIDGKQLVFTRKAEIYNEDFYQSELDSNNVWTKSKPLIGKLNTPLSEGAMHISQDGEILVFTGCLRPDTYGSCDLYVSFKTENGWSEAENLGPTINSDQWDSQPCLSPDKKDLYFASRRLGGYGGSDIYVSHLMENGYWTKPENLGPTINSPEDEQCPFIHADNQTLFFTSSYWTGYGDEDIFYTKKQLDGSWSRPTNLGYPINTIDREGTLFIAADGKTAYYASERSDSYGGLDLYTFQLRKDIRPTPTRWVKGIVKDRDSQKPITATIELSDLNSQQITTTITTDESGYYFLTIPSGKDYVFSVNKKGYLFYSDHFFLANNSSDSAYEKNIELIKIVPNASIVLNNIFFKTNSYELDSSSTIELNKLVKLLYENPKIVIEIDGYTDNVGTSASNITLSQNRAAAVTEYLISKGILKNRVSAKGFGEKNPIADNNTESGRAQNRRTEMRVIQL
jgi:outer membrane protein OmpA-like peptidoglycan-associated protein